MSTEMQLPVVVTPLAVKIMAATTPSAVRALIGVNSSGGGSGLPDGGAEGAVLQKLSGANQDANWSNVIDGGNY